MSARSRGGSPRFARPWSMLAAAPGFAIVLLLFTPLASQAEDPEAAPTPVALEAAAIADPGAAPPDPPQVRPEPAAPLLGPDVERTVGPPSGPPRTGEVLRTELERLSATIRCPVCQSHSINDSPSESARNMKGQVRGMLAAGYDDEQIYRYLESGYGEFIRLMPRREGWNLLVWLLPALALLVGGCVTVRTMRTPRGVPSQGPATASPPAAGDAPASAKDVVLDNEAAVTQPQDAWLRRVREEVDR